MARQASRLILLTGATRSGKSRLAVELARQFGPRILYLATCQPTDRDMKRRVARHQQERPSSWTTIEVTDDPTPCDIAVGGRRQRRRAAIGSGRRGWDDPATVIAQQDGAIDGAIFDCLTLYVSPLVMRKLSDETILNRIRTLCETMRRAPFPIVIVTNEVGWGVVPTTRLGRRFRDLAGFANQLVAQSADEVYLVVAGLPLRLKGNGAAIGAVHDVDRHILRAH